VNTLVVASLAVRAPALVASLAECVDTVIAADGGGAACLAAGVHPNVVVGDLDSLSKADEELLRQTGARFVIVPAEKDVTDLDLALDEAQRVGSTDLWLTGVFGGRLDHTLAAAGSLARHAALRPHVVEPDAHAWVLAPTGRPCVALVGSGSTVSLFALDGPATVTCLGLKYPLFGEELAPLDSRGLSNVIVGERASVEVTRGRLLVLSVLTNGTPLAREEVSGPDAE
jgi:thiamine pyrophosphokinase